MRVYILFLIFLASAGLIGYLFTRPKPRITESPTYKQVHQMAFFIKSPPADISNGAPIVEQVTLYIDEPTKGKNIL